MTNKKQANINLRGVVFVLIIFIMLLSFIYKYFETNFTRNLVRTYNSNWTNELKALENDQKEGSEAAEIVARLYDSITDDKKSYADTFTEFDNTIAILNVGINQGENHLNILKKNKEDLVKLRNNSFLLFGKKGELITNLISKLEHYYDLGIKQAERSLIQGYTFREYFASYKDYMTIQNFIALIKDDFINNPSKFFYVLSPLEKYSRDDFKITKEDDIKKYFPKSYDGIMRNVNYSKSYYSFTRDYVMGDTDSATYKLSKLDEDRMNLNFDYMVVFNESNDEQRTSNKEIITTLVDSLKVVKDIKSTIQKKSLFGSVGKFSDDVVQCKLYQYKEEYFYDLTKKHPSSKTFDGLVKELSTIAPTTEIIDELFDKKAVDLVNNDKLIRFKCNDLDTGKSYIFETIK